MKNNRTPRVGLHELYAKDPKQADRKLWGRYSNPVTRRGFFKQSGLAFMSAALGADIPFAKRMPEGLIPVAIAESSEDFFLKGKDGLKVLNDRPINAETPSHLLDDEVTPQNRLFIRNNGLVPDMARGDGISEWRLTIDGEVTKPLVLSLSELKKKFKHYTYHLVLECGGNGRAAFVPAASGNQWEN